MLTTVVLLSAVRPLPTDVLAALICSVFGLPFMACYWVCGNCLAIACSGQVVRVIDELRDEVNSAEDLREYRRYVHDARDIHDAIQLLSKRYENAETMPSPVDLMLMAIRTVRTMLMSGR